MRFGNFYGFLAQYRDELFKDEEFAALYCSDNGRKSVPPSLLATALILQAHDRVSDEEAKRGVAKNRLISTQDPQMKHGRKSSSKRFDGHKASIAIDTESQLILGAEVLAGNSPDKRPMSFAGHKSCARQPNTDWRGWYNWESARRCFFGRVKVHFQLLIASTVANLTLVVGKMGLGKIRPDKYVKEQLTTRIAA